MGRGHRGPADRVVATELLMGPGRVDLAAGTAEVGLQAELGVRAEGAEVGDEARGRERSLENLVGPRERVIRREVVEDRRSVSCGDRSDRNVDRWSTRRNRSNRRVERSCHVVVDNDGDRAGVLGVDRLVVEAARRRRRCRAASADQGDLSEQRAGSRRVDAAVADRGRGAGRDDLAVTGEGHRRERAGRAVVRHHPGPDPERRESCLPVVEGCDADDLASDARCSRRPELSTVDAAVSDRRDDGDSRVDEVVCRDRGRVLRPVVEGRADAHVHDICVVCERKLHRMDEDVAVRAAVAAEDAVGQKLCARSHADDLAVVHVSTAVSSGDARDVRAVRCVRGSGTEDLGAVGGVGVTRKGITIGMRRRIESRPRSGVVGIAHEIEAAAHLAAGAEATAELGQRVVEAAVDDRDRLARAVEAELVLGDVRAGEAKRVLQIDVRGSAVLRAEIRKGHGLDRVDRFDAGDGAEGRNLRRSDGDRHAVPEGVVGVALGELDTFSRRAGLEGVAFGLQSRLASPLRRRRTGELDEPLRRRLVGRAADSRRAGSSYRTRRCDRQSCNAKKCDRKPQTPCQHSLPFRLFRSVSEPCRDPPRSSNRWRYPS